VITDALFERRSRAAPRTTELTKAAAVYSLPPCYSSKNWDSTYLIPCVWVDFVMIGDILEIMGSR